MGVLFMATADLQTLENWDLYYNCSVVSSPAPRTGTYCYEVFSSTTTDRSLRHGIEPAISEGYVKFACMNPDNEYGSVQLYGGGVYHLSLSIHSDSFKLKRGDYTGTVLDSFTTNTMVWNLVEWYWVIDDSVGVSQIKVNGNMAIDYSGDTRNGGTAAEASLLIFEEHSTNGKIYFDDIVLRDDDWPGRGGLYVLVPNSGSDTENWVASAGNPEDCVDEIPMSESDYIYAPHVPSGVGHFFNVESPPVSGDIKAVATISYALLEDGADGYGRNVIRSGSVIGSGENYGLDTGGQWLLDCFDTDPATDGAWSYAAIESLEIGVET